VLGDEEHCPRMKKDIDRNFLLFLFLFGIISLCILLVYLAEAISRPKVRCP